MASDSKFANSFNAPRNWNDKDTGAKPRASTTKFSNAIHTIRIPTWHSRGYTRAEDNMPKPKKLFNKEPRRVHNPFISGKPGPSNNRRRNIGNTHNNSLNKHSPWIQTIRTSVMLTGCFTKIVSKIPKRPNNSGNAPSKNTPQPPWCVPWANPGLPKATSPTPAISMSSTPLTCAPPANKRKFTWPWRGWKNAICTRPRMPAHGFTRPCKPIPPAVSLKSPWRDSKDDCIFRDNNNNMNPRRLQTAAGLRWEPLCDN